MKTDIVIVGAGFAGASTAFHLSEHFSGSILLIEKEECPGFHASGRNASQLRQSTTNREIRRVLAASHQAYDRLRKEVGFQSHGSLLLGKQDHLEEFREPELIPSEYRDPQEVSRQIPQLKGHDFEAVLWTPSDGVMDISLLLQFYLAGARSRGADLWLNCELMSIEGDGPFRLETSRGSIETNYLVNAAGAWAQPVARMAGALQLPLTPFKRHLFVLEEVPSLKPDQPFVWSFASNFYFRPDSGGLLISICDEEQATSLEPTVSPDISQALAELVLLELPALRAATQREVWSCFRTKTPDDSFAIGWDSAAENFFWVAGLGGDGMGSSWELGRLAAERFLNPTHTAHQPFDPSRFETTLDPELATPPLLTP
jgi:D-arginine dehydrogenase